MSTAPKSPGLIPVPKEVSRAGKTFTQTYWMKPEEAAKKLAATGFNPNSAGNYTAEFKKMVDEFAGFKGAGDLAAKVTRSWVGSCKNPDAAMGQGAVAVLLGRDANKTPHVVRGDSNSAALLAAAKKAKDENDPLRKAMIGTYAVTQAALKLAGEPDVMKLTRGVKNAQAQEVLAAAKVLADAGVHYDDAAIQTEFNPLSCFTKHDGTSYHGFGDGNQGVVFSLDVPREAVMFSYKSTPGHSGSYVGEQEYTVMCAGPVDLAMRNIHGGMGKQIYDYFAARGLTGDQTPKPVAGAPVVAVDPTISFKIQGKGKDAQVLLDAVNAAGGSAMLSGGDVTTTVKASQVQAFVDAFSKTPAFDASVKSPEGMKTWLSNKALQAINAAKEAANPTKSYGGGGEGWKAPEPETKATADRVAAAIAGLGGGASAALQEKASKAGAAAFAKEAANAPKGGMSDEDAMDAHHSELLNKMHAAIPGVEEVFSKTADKMSPAEHELNESAMNAAMEELMGSEDPKKAAKAYDHYIANHLHEAYGAGAKPATALEAPTMAGLKHKGAAVGIGGAGEKHFYEDAAGKKFLVKMATEKGTSKEAPVKVAAQMLASSVGQAIKPGVSIPLGKAEHFGKAATVQPWLGDNLGNLAGVTPASLTASQKLDVAGEHVIDWLTGQHDSHGANLVKTPDGKIVGVDKEQALKHVHEDKLSTDYHPNKAAGENPPYYNKFWGDFAAGKVDFDPTSMKGAIEKAEAIPDAVHKAQVAEYAKLQKPGKPAAQQKIVDAAMERKANIRKDFESFISGHYEKKTGEKGAFTFNGGWKPASASSSSKAAPASAAWADAHAAVGEPKKATPLSEIPHWAKPDNAPMHELASAKGALFHWGAVHGLHSSGDSSLKPGTAGAFEPHPLVAKAEEAILAHPKFKDGSMTKKDAYKVASKVFKNEKPAVLEEPASSKAMKPADVEEAKAPELPKKPLVSWSNHRNFEEGHKIDVGTGALDVHAENWTQHHLGADADEDSEFQVKATKATDAHFKSKGATQVTMKEAHEEFKKQLDIATGKGPGTETKVPDAPEHKLKAFFEKHAGKPPPHRKWYWEGWAQAAMNKAGIPKEQHHEIFEKVQAQAKVMLAKHSIAGLKVSQDQAKAYIQAQAIKKGANPDVMPHVEAAPAGPKLEKKTHAEAKELHAYLKKKAHAGNASPEENAIVHEDPEDVPALKKAMAAIGIHVVAPPPKGPEHPYEYYWKTWANKAAKAETGKAAPAEVHAKISGLAKKFVAAKTLAGAKFTGKDLEKYISAAAKKQGEHPGEI